MLKNDVFAGVSGDGVAGMPFALLLQYEHIFDTEYNLTGSVKRDKEKAPRSPRGVVHLPFKRLIQR